MLGVVILAQSLSLDEYSIVYDGKDACLGECEDGFIVDGEKCRLTPDQVGGLNKYLLLLVIVTLSSVPCSRSMFHQVWHSNLLRRNVYD